MANYIGRRIRIITEDGGRTYEGYVHLIDLQTSQISLQRVVIPETGKKLNGLQTFFGQDIASIHVLEEECKKIESNDKIIPEKRERGPKLLGSKYVPSHLSKLKDFDPNKYLFKEVAKDEDNNGDVSKSINKSSDYDSSSDQETLDYEDCVYLAKINQRFHDAVNHIRDQSEIGVSFSGVCIGRDGKLSLIQMATPIDVFVFDIVSLGQNCWDEGLKSIFESPNVSKVMHDCRFPSDMLHHQYGIKLINIFDTQVAEVFVYRLYHHGGWPKWVNGLSCSLFDHLNLSTDMVNNLKIRENWKKEDQMIWMMRPLPKNLLKIAIKEVVHLLQLRHILTEKMMGEYIAGVDVYLAQVREASKEDVKKYQNNPHKLPVAFENLSGLLASRDSHRYNRHRYHRGPPIDHDFDKDDNGFRENCRGFVGVDVRYSNSSLWHEGGAWESNKMDKVGGPEKLATKAESNKISSGEASEQQSSSPTGRHSLLSTSQSFLESLKKATEKDQTVQSSEKSLSSDKLVNISANQNASDSSPVSCDNSDQELSIGRLIRSKITYQYETDVDLVPAGKMIEPGKCQKMKQKRLNEIEEMCSKVGEFNKPMKTKNIPHGDLENNSTAQESFMNCSSSALSPKVHNVSFGDNYTTARTTPNQYHLYSPNTSFNNSFAENYKTAPSMPSVEEVSSVSLTQSTSSSEGSEMPRKLSPMLTTKSELDVEEMYRNMPNMNRFSVVKPSGSTKSSRMNENETTQKEFPKSLQMLFSAATQAPQIAQHTVPSPNSVSKCYNDRQSSQPSSQNPFTQFFVTREQSQQTMSPAASASLCKTLPVQRGSPYLASDNSSLSLPSSSCSESDSSLPPLFDFKTKCSPDSLNTTSSKLKSTTNQIERLKLLREAVQKKSPQSQ